MSVTVRIFDATTGAYSSQSVIVGNKYKLSDVPSEFTQVNIMRPSMLGNKFKVGENPGEYKRGEAVVAHEEWFRLEMKKEASLVRDEIISLANRVAQGEKLALICCCKPKPCHGDIIAQAIMGYAERFLKKNE